MDAIREADKQEYLNYLHKAERKHDKTKVVDKDFVYQPFSSEEMDRSVIALKKLFGGKNLDIIKQIQTSASARKKLDEMTEGSKSIGEVCAAMLKNDTLSMEQTFGKPNDACQAFFQKIVNLPVFGVAVGLVICTNVITIGLSVDAKINDPDNLDTYAAIETGFTIFFVVEMFLRLNAFRFRFFRDGWSNLDLFIVIMACLDNFIITPMLEKDHEQALLLNMTESSGSSGLAASLSTLSLLRLLRLTRIVVSVRLFGIFEPLNVLLKGLYASLRSVVWVMFLQVFVLFLFGTAFTILIARDPRFDATSVPVGEFVNQDDPFCEAGADGGLHCEVFEWFGTIPKSMFTLFQCMTFDGWSEIARGTNKVMPEMMVLYVMFLVSSGFALFSLLTGVLVDHVNLASQDARKQTEGKQLYLPHIYKVMKLIDKDGTGSITFSEMEAAMEEPAFQRFLEIFGVGRDNVDDLFKYFDFDNDGVVQYWEFIQEFMAVGQQATRGDLFRMRAAVCRALADRTSSQTTSLQATTESVLHNLVDQRLASMNNDLARILMSVSELRQRRGAPPPMSQGPLSPRGQQNRAGFQHAMENVTDVTTYTRHY